MFEESAKQAINRKSGDESPVKSGRITRFNWGSMPVEELLTHYDEIQQFLPPTSLSDMDLEKELLLQFHTIRALQNRVMDDDEIPVNQRAQVANSVANSINKLTDLQNAIYTTERFKQIEGKLIRMLAKRDDEFAAKFIEEYETILKQHA